MALLTREQWLKEGAELPTMDVPVPEMGEGAKCRIRVLMGLERDKWDQALSKKYKSSMDGLRAILVTMCVVDDEGNRLFSDKDVPTVERFNGIALDRIYQAAWKLNKLSGTDLEADAKNSPSEENAGSGSSSREPSSTDLSDGVSDTSTAESSPNGRLISV